MSRRHRSRPAKPSLLPVCQALESRQLLSAALVHGVVTITGTSQADRVTIYRNPDNPSRLVVAENHGRHKTVISTFRYAKVVSILADLGNGADLLIMDDSGGNIERTRKIYGEGGNDTILGGNLDDVIFGGNGDDSLVGNGGQDVLVGGNGNDTLHGGAGDDSVYGNDGIDVLTGDAGTNLTDGGGGRDVVNGVQDPLPPPPATPTNFTATATSTSTIQLDWDDDPDETGYILERSLDGSTGWTQINAPGMDVTTYTSRGLTANTTYYYRLRAVNDGGASANTPVAGATTDPAPGTAPATPANFAVADTSPTTLHLTWDDVAGETGYRLEKSANGMFGWSLVSNLPADTISTDVTGLNPTTKYFYRLRASNLSGNSAFTPVASATTDDPAVTVPATPANFTAVAVSTTDIDLSWDDLPNETEYRIERAVGVGPFKPLITLTADTINYTDSGLTSGTTYHYRIVAHNAGGDSPSSTSFDTTF